MEVVTEITNVEFGKMINAAANTLQDNAEKINKLNVFPVPDGDTGTNMTLSMASGAEYERDETDLRLGSLAKATSKGLLMGARGNSGVILSQIFRGFANAVKDEEVLTARTFANGLMGGAETAYKAVMKPTEGTILTVIREAASAANNAAKQSDNVVEIAKAAYDASEKALASTPDLLPVLKEVGVVDSGGQGLVIVLEAFYAVLSGQEIKHNAVDNAGLEAMIQDLHNTGVQGELNPDSIKYGYCTEMMVDLAVGTTYDTEFDYDQFYDYLANLGDSLLVINDEEVVKVHIHTEHPGKVFEWGLKYGSLRKTKVDNMRYQQVEASMAAQKAKDEQKNEPLQVELAVIGIAAGDGVQDLFKTSGANIIIDSTQAPSTSDIVSAIKDSGAKQAIVLPNDSNIFMAADQAKSMLDIPVEIIKTRTVQQGLTALLVGFNPDASLVDNAKNMTLALADVKSGSVTTSVRDTTIGGLEIHVGDAIGLLDGDIVVAEPAGDIKAAAQKLLEKMLDEDDEIVTLIYGADSTKSDAEELASYIEELDSEMEVEIHSGNQPLYPIYLAVE
ncbi:DAK2 domain-containing protein [Weissella koreensis]|uniref:DAK2 domain-containing protein n=1 Tax=Weissella koreensis TaxID=165096 RepID=A0A7H1MK82_9LACO|nr:DAK2 domain-containing protein [Weissella koreensis]AVH74610.1 DAK2 domain-containing protein [Weissella koreensis]EJF33960.1 glycerone kinase [Weissella koreensis KCTC 3621]EJF34250.1 glycerone kinase [Weissella koreensis KCTC 3621]QGN19834.1 DAK2 domain-containing protein [Weissella koreensis]QNT63868.1 DAK2 domain-containing protein [Weissella koreensis]